MTAPKTGDIIFAVGDRIQVNETYGDEPEVGMVGTVKRIPGSMSDPTGSSWYMVDLDEGDGYTYFFAHEELDAI